MSLKTPIWELQVAIYDRLAASISGVSIYDFLPPMVSSPYIFMEEEQVTGVQDKSGAMQVVEIRLLCFSNNEDSQELKLLADSLADAMEEKIILPSWTTIRQFLVPNLRTYRAQNLVGDSGRLADVTFQFLFQAK